MTSNLSPPLSHAQFTFLSLLAQRAGQVYSRDEIIPAEWPDDGLESISDTAMDVLPRRTRLRWRELDPGHSYIVTVPGRGFRLDTNHAPELHLRGMS